MGIFNLTPDSFSGDGVAGQSLAQQLGHIDALAEAGADIIDIGAQSTRPGARMLTAAEEWERLAPLVGVLSGRKDLTLSLDTYHPENALAAIDAGFVIINDVSGSVEMMKVIAPTSATLVVMHSLGIPADPAVVLPEDSDPVAALLAWGRQAVTQAAALGIRSEQLVLDVGIGFGKTARQSLALLKHIAEFKALGCKLLVGHSRKSFLVPLLTNKKSDRDAATLAFSLMLAQQGVDFLRVHATGAHRDMLAALEAMG